MNSRQKKKFNKREFFMRYRNYKKFHNDGGVTMTYMVCDSNGEPLFKKIARFGTPTTLNRNRRTYSADVLASIFDVNSFLKNVTFNSDSEHPV